MYRFILLRVVKEGDGASRHITRIVRLGWHVCVGDLYPPGPVADPVADLGWIQGEGELSPFCLSQSVTSRRVDRSDLISFYMC